MTPAHKEDSKALPMVYYTVRFPISWEQRITNLQKAMDNDKPSDVLTVTTAVVVRQAFKIGLETLMKQYEVQDGR
jgi:hypothetical protein